MLALYVLPIAWLAYVLYGVYHCLQTKVPGPWYTNLTSLVLKYHEIHASRRVWIQSLHKQYGPVVRLAPNETSFANLEGMKEIYQSGGSGYDKTEFYDLFTQFGHRTMFSTLNKYDHAQRKKLFADRYAMTNIARPEITAGIQERAASVIKQCTKSIGGYLDVYITLHCYALDCASHFLFSPGGTDTLNNANDLLLMKELSSDDSLRDRWLQYYSPTLSAFISRFQGRDVPLSNNYALEKATQEHPSEPSLIYRLQSKSSFLQTIEMAGECMDHMAAGIDTTGDGLCFLMHELSLPQSQHIQERLREEFFAKPNVKLDELPYLDAVIKEGLRVFPPIPMSLPRYVPAGGRNISGYHIPGGSIVSCQAFSLHQMNDEIFPDSTRFVPERWLEVDGAVQRNRLFFAFASGGRGCIGKNLAMIEMKTLIKEVYSRFHTSVAPEMKGDMSIDDTIIASRPKDQTCLLNFIPVNKH